MRLTQGAFSFLPDLTDEQIVKQIQYAIGRGWAISVESTDDPHPRNSYWDMWGLPLFGIKDAAAIMFEVNSCRKAKPSSYVKVQAFDNTRTIESCSMSFIVQRPNANEPGFGLIRNEGRDRRIQYTVSSYSCQRPEGSRY